MLKRTTILFISAINLVMQMTLAAGYYMPNPVRKDAQLLIGLIGCVAGFLLFGYAVSEFDKRSSHDTRPD